MMFQHTDISPRSWSFKSANCHSYGFIITRPNMISKVDSWMAIIITFPCSISNGRYGNVVHFISSLWIFSAGELPVTMATKTIFQCRIYRMIFDREYNDIWWGTSSSFIVSCPCWFMFYILSYALHSFLSRNSIPHCDGHDFHCWIFMYQCSGKEISALNMPFKWSQSYGNLSFFHIV